MTRRDPGRQIVVCGLGGQGILFLAKLVASAAILDGHEVLAAETHGMAQRGGAVEAHLKIGSFASSLVRPGSADTVLALDPTRTEAACAFLRPGGMGFSDRGGEGDGSNGANGTVSPALKTVDASRRAREMEHPRGRNLILLGFASAVAPERFPSQASLLATLDRLSPAPAAKANREAFRRGSDLA